MPLLPYSADLTQSRPIKTFAASTALPPYALKVAIAGVEDLLVGAGQVTSGGNPGYAYLIPSLQEAIFYVAVPEGTSVITADILQASNTSPRPKLTIKANEAIGVNADQETSAGSGTGYVTITDEITATADGVVEVRIKNQQPNDPAYVDNLGRTGATSDMSGSGTGKGGSTWIGPPGMVIVGGPTRIPSI
jgi:hypothetical protein